MKIVPHKKFLPTAIVLATLAVLTFPIGSNGVPGQTGGLLSSGPRQSIVMENGSPAIKFVSRDGSVSVAYFKKHGDEDAFALEVIDWDNLKQKSGWMYFTAKRVIFESDESEKRGFDVSKDEARLKIENRGLRFFIIKISGKEKRFMVRFSPPLVAWGKHQDPVFELIRKLFTDYGAVVSELQREVAKLTPQETSLSDTSAPLTSTQPTAKVSRIFVDVSSEPSGAEIYVDGSFVGSTPSKLSLEIGGHSIKVSRPGFRDWERKLSFDADSSKTLNAILEKKQP
jgi:hypothetical protein